MTEKELPAVMALSYLGDAVYSLYVRHALVRAGISHAGELNRLSLLFVTAERQAKRAELLLPLLSEEEAGVFRRAFNHKGLPRRAHATHKEYRLATGFEAVLGALSYLGDEKRLNTLLEETHKDLLENIIKEKEEIK